MKLYFHPMSSSSRRAYATALHLGIAFDRQLIDLANPGDRAQLALINPNHKIPVLVDGDFVLWESHAIMRYLCGKTPNQTLYPNEPRMRADVDRWLDWSSAHLAPAVCPISFERLWKKFVGGGEPDQALIARSEKFFHQFAKVLDDHLASREWLAGKSPTLADYSVAAVLMYRAKTQLPVEGYAHLLRHLDRVATLDAWRQSEC